MIECSPEALDPAVVAAAALPHPRPFVLRMTIGPESTSRALDHVWNVEYVRWIDLAAERAAASMGWSRTTTRELGAMWFVARHEVDFLAECRAGEELAIFTWVRDLRRAKSWRETVAVRTIDATVVMRAASLWVFVDLATRRPRRVPEPMCAALDPLLPASGESPSGAPPDVRAPEPR